MSDEKPPATPDLHVVPPPTRKGNNRWESHHYHTLTREMYDACLKVYLVNRSATEVSKVCRVAMKTAYKVVNHGYPERGLTALKDRALAYDTAKIQAENQAHAETARALVDKRSGARQQRNAILALGKVGYAALFKAWSEESQHAAFVIDPPSQPTTPAKPHTVTGDERELISAPSPLPRDANALVLAGARLMAGFKVFSELEDQGLALSEPADKVSPANSIPPGLHSLPPEDLDYILKSGRLPPHLDEEAVLGIGTGKNK